MEILRLRRRTLARLQKGIDLSKSVNKGRLGETKNASTGSFYVKTVSRVKAST